MKRSAQKMPKTSWIGSGAIWFFSFCSIADAGEGRSGEADCFNLPLNAGDGI
jgi:hypothetical protein